MAAATRRAASSLVSRYLLARTAASPAVPSALRRPDGTRGLLPGVLQRFGTAAAAEEPISPPVQVRDTQLLINGKFVDAASGKTFPTLDPRTGEVIAHVAEGDAEDINRAVAAARKAFDEGPWPRMTAYERSRILLRFADLIEKHNDEIAALETWDNGKPYEQAAQIEVPMVARLMRYYAGWVDKIHGLVVPADGPHHVQVLYEPIGVAGQIIPWNFPLLMFAWKVGPALACGNTVVLKTAEQTPLSALYVAKLMHEVEWHDLLKNSALFYSSGYKCRSVVLSMPAHVSKIFDSVALVIQKSGQLTTKWTENYLSPLQLHRISKGNSNSLST
uniref:Uncharacterized protein n=1 Tax=Avena sativa TaxID=4498 RepID=A0ACD5ZRG3_AVESA